MYNIYNTHKLNKVELRRGRAEEPTQLDYEKICLSAMGIVFNKSYILYLLVLVVCSVTCSLGSIWCHFWTRFTIYSIPQDISYLTQSVKLTYCPIHTELSSYTIWLKRNYRYNIRLQRLLKAKNKTLSF